MRKIVRLAGFFWGFLHRGNKVYVLVGSYAESLATWLRTFRKFLSVPYSVINISQANSCAEVQPNKNYCLKLRVSKNGRDKERRIKVKVAPLQATNALRVGRGIALPNLRPRH